jgi:hypothetical protein
MTKPTTPPPYKGKRVKHFLPCSSLQPIQPCDTILGFNKKAQVGKIIATLPVLILIVIVMGIFVALTYAVAAQNSPAQLKPISRISLKNNLLLQTIDYTLALNNQVSIQKDILIFDAYVDFEDTTPAKRLFSKDELEKKLEDLIRKNDEKECIILSKGKTKFPAGIVEEIYFADDFYLCVKGTEYFSSIYHEKPTRRLRNNFIDNYVKAYHKNNLFDYISFKNKKGETVTIEYGYGPYYLDLK